MLEFSGIGNPETLTKIGVQPKIDLYSAGEKVIFCALTLRSRSLSPPLENEPITDKAFRFENRND